MAKYNVDIAINAKDNATSALKQVDSSLAGLQGSIGTLVKGAGLVGLAAGLLEVGKAAFALGREAAGVERLRASFDDLAVGVGQSSEAMLSAMRAASSGTISDASLILSANKAMLLGVADSAGEMTQLIEVASARGRAMGLSTEQAFSDLVTGIGRMSPMILDNLGIVTGGEKVFDDYAASLGRTAESLTDVERKQALLNKVVVESADMVANMAESGDDAATSFARMDTAAANAKQALGELFAPAMAREAEQIAAAIRLVADATATPVSPVADAAGEALRAVLENMALGPATADVGAHNAAIQSLGNQYNNLALQIGRPVLSLAALAQGEVAFTQESIAAASALFGMGDATDSTAVAIAHLANMAATAAPNISALRGQILDLVQAEQAIISIADQARGALESSFKSQVSELGVAGALSGFGTANQELEQTLALLDEQDASQEKIDFTVAGLVDRWRDVNSQLGKTTTAVTQIDKAFEDLKSKVDSVLSGSLNLSPTGVNSSDLLPREDAIQEDAFRLADVAVNGFASPWADYLNTKFPEMFGEAFEGGDIKTKAAQLLKDFEDGLNPQLIDKDKAKERVKRMILGEASMAELAAQVTAELQAEMGGNAPADLAAKVQSAIGGGGTGGAAAGADFAGTTLDAVITSDVGGNMVATVVNQAAGKSALLKTSGASNGKLWGDAFLGTVRDGVPGALIAILVSLVLPEVIAKMAAAKSAAGTVD